MNDSLPNRLSELAFSHIIAKAVNVAAQINLGSYLTQPQNVADLAKKLNYNSHAFKRFLQVLSAYEVVNLSDDNETVSATEMTTYLNRLLSPHIFNSAILFENLEFALQNNNEVWSNVFGKKFYPSLIDSPGELKQFEEWCALSANDWLPCVSNLYDFGKHKNIVDIGGGNGQLLFSFLEKYPEMTGIVFDQVPVIEALQKSNTLFTQRVKLIGGDFFKQETIPNNGECYILCRTLLNWDDKDAATILNNCYQAIPSGSRFLIIDFVLPEATHQHYKRSVMGDLNLLLLINSTNRSKQQWLNLVSETPFVVIDFHLSNSNDAPEPFMPVGLIEMIKE